MIRHAKITVFLLDKSTVVFKNTTFLEVVKACLSHPLANSNPLMLQINEEKLYFNTTLFIAWVNKEMNAKELFSETEITNLVRNTTTITVENHVIDANSLWQQKESQCFLIDADIFAFTKFDARFENCF